MKISSIVIVFLAISSVGLQAQTPTTATSQGNVPAPTDYQIIQQDGNSRVWQREVYEQAPDGQIVARPHQFTELATGLNYRDASGQWQPSKEEIDIQPDGTLEATQGQHQVYFPGNIYGGEIELVQPDGVQLHSCPVGLSYDDGSNTVLIAVLTNSVGQLVGSNQVIYTNAFVGLNADLLYTDTKAGLEQDVVIRAQPPTPASLGLNPDTTRLQVLTEFLNPPQPAETTSTLPEQAGLALTDDTLDFGAMQMIPGKAFMLGEDSPSARVGKSWVTLQGRQFLVEAVPVAALAEQLENLPMPTAQTASMAKTRVVSRNLVLPPQHLAKAGVQPLKLARTGISRKPGVVLDYLTVNSSLTNYTFQGDTTYYISGTIDIYGTNTFEGGAVLKYATNSSIYIGSGLGARRYPTIIWQGSAYRPVIFTAKDDNSVGDEITGSTGSPSGYYANPALDIPTVVNTENISGFRFLYAQEAVIQGSANGTPTLANGQFVNCACGFSDAFNSANLENVLFENVQTDFFNLDYATLNVENSTFSSNSYLTTASPGASYQTLVPTFTNCIFANVANLTNNISEPDLIYGVGGSYNGFYNCPNFGSSPVIDTFYPFQTVGGGKCYLTNGCDFHNAGTTNVDLALLANLAAKTTYPPIAFTNVTFSSATNFSPQAQRDNTNNPDLGYHYDPIDYSFGGCSAGSNLTFSAGTAVGWFRTSSGWEHAGYGIDMGAGVTVLFSGTATAPDYWVRLNTVQEQDYTAGYGQAGIETWVNSDLPTVSGQFLRCSAMAGELRSYFSDDYGTIQARMVNSEFWGGTLDAYGDYMYFTNCLMQRVDMELWNGSTGTARIAWDCTFFGGEFYIERTSGGSTFVSVRNSSFDGTSISTSDSYGSNPTYSDYNYNAYTNSTDPFSIGGGNDVPGTTFNFQTSWFGSYYLPTNSPLINAGSTNANYVGLYHFTTQTNQIVEGDSIVDIGYHYVATDQYGNPLDSNGDGIPDYLEDPLGNGLPYDGTNWALAILTEPINQTVNQGDNVTISVSAGGVAPLAYQWYFGSGVVANATNAALILDNVQTNSAGNYSVVVTNNFGSITSSVAALTVMPPPTITITNPVNNALIVGSTTNVTLAAVASNVVSSITQVQFFQNQTYVGIVTNAPYTLVWSNALAGSYALTAVAADNHGLSVTSSVANLTISPLFASNTMYLWLKADAITNLTNNASIATWYDQSGHAKNATQTTSADQPLYIANALNGLPAVQFNGSNKSFSLPNCLTGTTGAEAMVVLKLAAYPPPATETLWEWGASGDVWYTTSGQIDEGFGSSSGTAYTIGTTSQPLNQYHVYDVAGANGYWAAWINGVLQLEESGNTYGYNTSGTYYFGYSQSWGGAYFAGDVAEVLVFNRPLTMNEHELVNVYLNDKYNLGMTLPVAPTNLRAAAISTNQVSLTWVYALGTSSATFEIGRSTTSNGVYSVVATVQNALSYVDTNLASTTTYYYQVAAVDAVGNSIECGPAWATTLANGVSLPLGNLLMWLRADTGVVIQGTNNGVTTWYDQSGSNNNATQTTPANQPIYVTNAINGLPVLWFNATNADGFNLPTVLSSTTNSEAFVVLKVTTASPASTRSLWKFGSYGTGYPETDGAIADAFASHSVNYIGQPAQPLTQYHVYNVTSSTGMWAAWINGELQFLTTNNTYYANVPYGPSLGWDNQTDYYFDGEIAEVLIFNRPLLSNERLTVNGYLNLKYGLVTNAPAVPTNLVATAISTNQISLTWGYSLGTSSTTFEISRSTTSNGVYAIVATVQNALSYVDTNLVAATTFYYQVAAEDAVGTSADSNVAWATTMSIGPSLPLNNLLLWLKADTGVVRQGTNNEVITWYDQSGNYNNATQTTPANQPVYVTNAINGLPALWFNATNADGFNLLGVLSSTTNSEAFVVLKVTTASPASMRSLWKFGAASTGYPETGGAIADSFASHSVNYIGQPTQPLTQYHVFNVTSSTGGMWAAWINGEQQYLATNNAYYASVPYGPSLGWDDQAYNYFDGQIAEVLIFNRSLLSSERLTVNGYLNLKYGLVTNAPAAPTNLVATAISTNQIGLTWGYNLGTSSTTFAIGRSTTSNGVYAVVATVQDATSYVDTNLAAATAYYYQVAAVNAAGSSGECGPAWAITSANESSLPFGSLLLWLKADTGAIRQGTNNGVTTWYDQSGSNNNATQTTPANQPVYVTNAINGLPAVWFNATNSDGFNLPQVLNNTTGAEAFVVLKVAQAYPAGSRPLWYLGAAGGAYPTTAGTIQDSFGSGDLYNIGQPAQPLTQYHVYEVSSQSNSWTAWINGMMQYQSTVNSYKTSTYYGDSLGYSSQAGQYFDGDLAEILIFNRALTPDEREVVNDYLNGKYGLAPVVSIINPTNNQVFTASSNMVINAMAFDPAGISRVQFFEGTTSLGIVTNTPYGITWTNTPSGSYPLIAVATDNNGRSTTSSVVNVIIDIPPTVLLTAPANNALYIAGSNIDLSALAAAFDDPIANVQFFAGGTNLGTVTNAPYNLVWSNAVAGSYAMTAVATDEYGLMSTSSVANITVDNPPTVSLTGPTNNAFIPMPTNIVLTATATDSGGSIVQVRFFQGSASLGIATNSPYSFTWNNVAPGTYTLTAQATDNNGITSTSAVVNIMAAGVSIVTPTNNLVLASPANIPISVAVVDSAGISQVQFFQGTTSLGIITTPPYSMVWSNAPSGVYGLTAQATDGNGLVLSSSIVNVILDTDPETTYRNGDGISDYTAYLEGRNPLVAGSVPDTNNVINLQIYTPLQ